MEGLVASESFFRAAKVANMRTNKYDQPETLLGDIASTAKKDENKPLVEDVTSGVKGAVSDVKGVVKDVPLVGSILGNILEISDGAIASTTATPEAVQDGLKHVGENEGMGYI